MSLQEPIFCPNHPKKKADHTCRRCGKKICFECVSVSFGAYVCLECDPDLKESEGHLVASTSLPGSPVPENHRPGKLIALLQNRKVTYGILVLSAALCLFTVFFVYDLIKNPPLGKLSTYRVAFYPVKSEGKSVTRILEDKGIRVEWKYLENKLTPDGGVFVYFADPEAAGTRPIWYVKDEIVFSVNDDARDLCNSEISETLLFSKKGITEEDILLYLHGKKR